MVIYFTLSIVFNHFMTWLSCVLRALLGHTDSFRHQVIPRFSAKDGLTAHETSASAGLKRSAQEIYSGQPANGATGSAETRNPVISVLRVVGPPELLGLV